MDIQGKLDANGKLIISDDMSDDLKKTYKFVNSLNLDLANVLQNEVNLSSDQDDSEKMDSSPIVDNIDNSNLDAIIENDDPTDDLENFF